MKNSIFIKYLIEIIIFNPDNIHIPQNIILIKNALFDIIVC